MKQSIAELVSSALARLADALPQLDTQALEPAIERARDPRHGQYSCNIALVLAKPAALKPRELAERIVAALPESPLLQRVEIAGPGFINFHLTDAARQAVVGQILEAGERFGRSDIGGGRSVLVEFVSANPTGPLHVGHGRHAAYGATLAALLEAVGFRVRREYYLNDAGRQMDILTVSVWLRYLLQQGEQLPFPSNAYRGEYINTISTALSDAHGDRLRQSAEALFAGLPADAPEGDKEAHIDALIGRARAGLGESDYRLILDAALHSILGDIQDDLSEFGITIDEWFSERRLLEQGLVQHALEKLRERDELYAREGAQWFRASRYGDDKDRVVIRENGQPTYIASDIAYHLNKRERGHDLLLDVLGADHHGYVARVRAGLQAMGEPGDCLEVRLVQFVSLYRAGKKVQMSTRSGEFVTLRELRAEVGNDAARFFYVMRSNDQHLDFDLELAKTHSSDNPVYYIQYAHARVASVFRQLAEKGWDWEAARGCQQLALLTETHEQRLMSTLSRFGEVLETAALQRAPQQLVHYLRELANDFHTYYNAHPFLVADAPLRDARLALIAAAQQVLRNGLALLGVSAPESM